MNCNLCSINVLQRFCNPPSLLVLSQIPRLEETYPRYRWHAGVLYGRDSRLAQLVLGGLRAHEDLVVGDNQPYSVSDATDYTIVAHGERRGLAHVELEVRQDLLASEADIDAWVERLADVLGEMVPRVCPSV